ncbi:MAG TPA: lytic transglycosylase domain-containing protein [Gammaproteobacteria bacterium]
MAGFRSPGGDPGRLRPMLAGLSGLCLCAMLFYCGPAVATDIYKYVDPAGGVHLSDRPLGPGYVLIFRSGRKVKPQSGFRNYALNLKRYGPVVDQVAQRHRLSADLVHAVVQVESAYNPGAVSRKGAVGLMQLMPETARRYGVHDRRDPHRNLEAGVRYLRDLILRFNNVVLALAAYNAGENAVERYGNKVPPFPETQQYVRKVLQAWKTRLDQLAKAG